MEIDYYKIAIQKEQTLLIVDYENIVVDLAENKQSLLIEVSLLSR